MTDDQLKAIEERHGTCLKMNTMIQADDGVSLSDWYELDVGALLVEVRRLRERQCALRELIGEFAGDSETTGALLEQFARRAGLIE